MCRHSRGSAVRRHRLTVSQAQAQDDTTVRGCEPRRRAAVICWRYVEFVVARLVSKTYTRHGHSLTRRSGGPWSELRCAAEGEEVQKKEGEEEVIAVVGRRRAWTGKSAVTSLRRRRRM